jgi:hypothetical protein
MKMEDKPKVTKIDGVNYVQRTIPTVDGPMVLEGLTARALINALRTLDPDDLVCYMAEVTPEMRGKDLIIGVIAALGGKAPCGVAFLFGPEGVRGLKEAGMI